MHGLDLRYLNKFLLKMLLLMTLHCINIPHKFYISNLSWYGKKITTDNRLHSFRNLPIACLLSLKEKVLEYTSLQMLMTLLFSLICSNIHNQYLSSFSVKLSSPTPSLSKFSWHIFSPCWPSVLL